MPQECCQGAGSVCDRSLQKFTVAMVASLVDTFWHKPGVMAKLTIGGVPEADPPVGEGNGHCVAGQGTR